MHLFVSPRQPCGFPPVHIRWRGSTLHGAWLELLFATHVTPACGGGANRPRELESDNFNAAKSRHLNTEQLERPTPSRRCEISAAGDRWKNSELITLAQNGIVAQVAINEYAIDEHKVGQFER